MNTLETESKLAEKYKYKPLPDDLSEKYRNYFLKNIPSFLSVNGNDKPLYTKNGEIICVSYTRIVIGDYGAFIEYHPLESTSSRYIVKRGQEYRINDPKYSKNVKYEWYTTNDGSDIKIYKQKKTVSYADYKKGMYYVSVHEVSEGGEADD